MSSAATAASASDDLDLMFERAVSGTGNSADVVAIETLATLVKANPLLAKVLARKIGERLHANCVAEVRRTIEILDTCMQTAGDALRQEVGKFRFLNEIVKLLSPSRAVRVAPATIRQRLLDLMLVWTAQYPHIPKIREAYDMLRKQGVPHAAPTDHRVAEQIRAQRAEGAERTVFDSIPRHLLLSTDKADIQKAKLLIEQVLEREQRVEQLEQQRAAEMRVAAEVAAVLGEMLTAGNCGDGGELMAELYDQCRSMHISMAAAVAGGVRGGVIDGGAAEAESAAPAAAKAEIVQLLQVNDALVAVMQRYKSVVLDGLPDTAASATTTTTRLPPQSPTTAQSAPISNTALLTAVLGDAPLNDTILALTTAPPTTPTSGSSFRSDPSSDEMLAAAAPDSGGNAFDDLGTLDAIFTATSLSAVPSTATDHLLLADPAGAAGLLEPTISSSTQAAVTQPAPSLPAASAKPLAELDMFGLDSVISGLKSNLVQPVQAATVPAAADAPASPESSAPHSTSSPTPLPATCASPDKLVDAAAAAADSDPPSIAQPAHIPLSELHVSLATIRPSRRPVRCVLDDPAGLKVQLHLALDRPRPDVSVAVLTVTNQSALRVTRLTIDASVAPRPAKVRLLQPSTAQLAAAMPFRPPTDSCTQLVLVACGPQQQQYDMVCWLSYQLGDDPDAVKESVSVTALPALVDEQ